jgi:lambda family phage portal protein
MGARQTVAIEVLDTPVLPQRAFGGAIEGAERTTRETFSWNPSIVSPDQQINPVKEMADARGRDAIQNDGYAMGAVNTHRDNIVGSEYRLNLQPDWRVLGGDEKWAEDFQLQVESEFNLLADSPDCFFDASGSMTLTGLIRLAVGGFLMTGEVLGTAEWKRGAMRPFSTAIQMVSPTRLSNPDGLPDDRFLSRGVVRDVFGEPTGYWIRATHPTEYFDARLDEWRLIPARKPWGRRQVIHIIEPLQPGQTRGVADMVAVLKNMRMTKKFKDVVLQNAVVNASYAAAIESELPREVVMGSMGLGQSSFGDILGQYMSALSSYAGASQNIAVDGVKMPHLFPGTKLALKPMGTPGGVGTDFEDSLLRHTAAALGLSYEQFSRDYSKTNYSSARASMSETWKYMQSRKKSVADRMASMIFQLWLEERINAGAYKMPKGQGSEIFYDPLKRAALTKCTWIGASRGQIDEMKETQSAMLRIQAGLSTYEAECSRLGEDFRRVFAQRAREQKLMEELDLTFSMNAEKPGANDRQQTLKDDAEEKPPAKKPAPRAEVPMTALLDATHHIQDDEL